MELLCIGISHHTASAELRDRVVLEPERLAEFYSRLHNGEGEVVEAVALSTCNRTEVYALVRDPSIGEQRIREALDRQTGSDVMTRPEATFRRQGREAAHHLMRVAAGIDSLVIGENQILGQVRCAWERAVEHASAATLLNRLFQGAVRAGKRARSETRIGEGAVSVAFAAVSMAVKVFADLSQHRVLVVGAGETGRLVARHFAEVGPAGLIMVNRTFERAEESVAALGGTARRWEELDQALIEADIVVTATASPEPFITLRRLESVRKARGRRPLVVVDIARPRDVEPAVRGLDNVFLYDMDGLESIVRQNLTQRAREVPKVEALVGEEVDRFFEWYDTLGVAPLLRALRASFRDMGQQVVKKNDRYFCESDREHLERHTRALVNRLLHDPTVRLKRLDRETPAGLAALEAIRELFDLDLSAYQKENGLNNLADNGDGEHNRGEGADR